MRGLILSGVALIAASAGALGEPAEREGRGDRREALNAIEATPFDHAMLASLEDWKNADGFAVEDMRGSVLMLVTLDAAQPGSLVIASTIKRLSGEFGSEGLRVVALHPDAGWDEFQSYVESGMIPFPVARDRLGLVRKALQADNDPDVYLIDRAGQLRYADIANGSIGDAVEQLIAETAEHASGEAQRRTTTEGRIAAGLEQGQTSTAESAGITIPAAMYAKADWPEHNAKLSAKSFQGKPMPAQLGSEQWLTDEVSTDGKVVVIDFWATWCGPCKRAAPTIDKLQKANRDELAVLAISGSGEKAGIVKKYLVKNAHSYSYLHDDSQKLNNAFGVRGIPHTVVLSTDGVVRWQGNPLNSRFTEIVEQIIREDPAVQARKRGQTIAYEPAPTPSTPSKPVASSPSTDFEWPEPNTGKLYANTDVQGDKLDNPLTGLRWINGSQRPDTEGKVVVIDFWASWCGPCKQFSPRLDAMQKKYSGEVVAIGVAGQRETLEKVESYLATTDHTYADAFDGEQRLYKSLRVAAIPHVVILSSDGVARWQGFPGDADFEGILEQVVRADRAMRVDD